jgi:Cu2+-exporting ATPase
MSEVCTHCQSPITHTKLLSPKIPKGLFCCYSCQQVAELLAVEGLEDYYTYLQLAQSQAPKSTLQSTSQKRDYSNPDLLQQIGHWQGAVHTLDLGDGGIHCAACGWLLEKVLIGQEGIESVQANFPKGQLKVRYNSQKTSLTQILKRCQNVGYPLRPLESKTSQKSEAMDRALLARIAVAGFAWMNVMTFAVATYADWISTQVRDFEDIFHIWALLLNLPVILYSATPFYQKAWQGLKQGIIHMDLPVSLGILFSTVASIVLWVQDSVPFFDTAPGVVFFLLWGRWWVQKFEKSLVQKGEWLQQLMPDRLRVKTNQNWTFQSTSELVAGQIVQVQTGEIVPARAKLLFPEMTQLDPKWMTGESRWEKIRVHEEIPSGWIAQESIEILLLEETRTAEFGLLHQAWSDRPESIHSDHSPAEKIVPWFTALILVLAAGAGLQGYLDTGIQEAFLRSAVILILACPCALALARPVSQGLAMDRAKQKGFLLQNPDVLSKIGTCQKVVFDKTGTLTAEHRPIEKWQWLIAENPLLRSAIRLLTEQSGHPVSRSLHQDFAQEASLDICITAIEEIPHIGIRGIVIDPQGKEYPIGLWKSWLSPQELQIAEIDPKQWELCFGSTQEDSPNHWNHWITFCGQGAARFSQREELLAGTREMFQTLHKMGIQTAVLSGDHPERVAKLCQNLGIHEVHGGLSPEAKAKLVQKWRAEGTQIIALGDGFNDGPMLSHVHVAGIAFGGLRALGAKADLLALSGHWRGFGSLLTLHAQSKKAELACYGLSILYNVGAIALAWTGHLAPLIGAIAMPLSSVSVALAAWLVLRKA